MGKGTLFQIKNRGQLMSRLGENILQDADRETLSGGHDVLFLEPAPGSINFPRKLPNAR
jgi:hypothetical protein